MQFRSAEAAFQAQKVPLESADFIFCTPSVATSRPPCPFADWDDVLDEAMHKVVYAKFKNENLRQILSSTEDEELVEDTHRMARQHSKVTRVLSASTSRDATSSAKS